MHIKHTSSIFSFLLLTACGGGGDSSDSNPIPVNIFPSATGQSVVTDEDVELPITLSGSDTDGSIAGFTITTLPTNGTLSGTLENLVYTPNLNFNGTDTLQFTVTDNNSASSTPAAISITVNSVNDVPTTTGDASVTITENQTATGLILSALASDPEGDDITVSLGEGEDENLFSINTTTSELTFSTAPDFETPTDVNADNIYQVSVLFTDSNGGQASTHLDIEVTDESILDIVTTFPTANANLGGDVDEITVQGKLIDREDNEVLLSDVEVLTVNGIQVTIADNATWSATVPVNEQNNTLLTEVESTSNNTSSDIQQIVNVSQPTSLESFANGVLDSENNRILVLDLNYNGIFALDLSTNAVSNISDNNIGTGQRFVSPNNIALDSANDLAYVSDNGLNAVLEIDLTTGNRTIISDPTTGDGLQLESPSAVFYDNINRSLYVTDLVNDQLIQIDTSTGNRTIVSNDADDSIGDNLTLPIQISVDSIDKIAYILDLTENSSIISIDLTTGDRDIVANADIGSGVVFSNPRGMILSNDRSSLYISNLLFDEFASGEIIEVDLSTLQRQIISNNSTGTGIGYEAPNGLVSSNSDNSFFVLDNSVEAVIETNATTGDRNMLIDPNNTRNFLDASTVILDSANERLLIIDENELSAIDISYSENAGSVRPLSNDVIGSGSNLRLASSLAFDEENNRVFTVSNISDVTETLIAINLTTGERTLVSDFSGFSNTDGSTSITDIAYDASKDIIIFFDRIRENSDESVGALASIELATGEITVLSTASFTDLPFAYDMQRNSVYGLLSSNVMSLDLSTGIVALVSTNTVETNLQLFNSLNLTFDPVNDAVIVAEPQTNQVLSIDIESGNRKVISSVNDGVVLRAVRSLAVDSTNNRLFLSDLTEDNVYIIDTETGERAYVTH